MTKDTVEIEGLYEYAIGLYTILTKPNNLSFFSSTISRCRLDPQFHTYDYDTDVGKFLVPLEML